MWCKIRFVLAKAQAINEGRDPRKEMEGRGYKITQDPVTEENGDVIFMTSNAIFPPPKHLDLLDWGD